MIGTEEMSTSTGMDISESFRAEDLSKTDFFDFVTAPDMGIGIGVGVGVGVDVAACVDLQQQQHHQPQHTQQPQHSHNHSQGHQPNTSQTPQQQRNNNNNMTHDVTDGSGGGAGIVAVSNRNGSTSNGGDPTLQGYEFWHQDKDNSRLDSSSIFEDLDRYCWQQQLVTASGTGSVNTSSVRCSTQPSPTSPQAHPLQQHQQQQQQQHQQQHQHQQHQQQQQQPNASSSSSAAGSSSDTISSLETADGQIYTLTVLNGAEPWLKREPEQLPSSLDLDSLLGSFPGYIKSEYPYDDSGFSTDGKDVIVSGADANGLSSISQSQSQQSQHGQSLPSLVTAISLAGGGGGGVNDLGQQLAQFQNNNNDWHMADHNAEAEQNSAESLLRSALQGKGYAKGLQHMQNGLSLPVVKDDEMRRLLFTPDDAADALGFADSTLSTAQMFEDAQSMGQVGGGGVMSASNHGQHGGNATNIIVDDMFLSLENAFSDDFEKLKRLANEVQQFCSGGNGTPTPGDYSSSDVLMQISPSGAAASAATAPQLQPLANAQQQPQQQQQQPPPQPLKPEVSTSTVSPAGAGGRLGGVSKPKKQYKRSNSSINNNNNPSVANNNNSKAANGNSSVLGVVIGNGGSSSSSGSASSSSNSPPANCNASGGSGSSGGGSSGGGGGQRKERSLHYCSICSKGFKDKYSVNVHIRTHTGEKPFACSLCGKSFRQKAHLAKHYQTHMTQKNNGSLIKGSSSKHQRAGANAANAAASLAQQRQLSAVSSAVATPSLMSAGVVLSGPNTPPGVLPPANGLLANR
ncbi:myb-like protein AA [Drosophila albomicans]|uniref:Myb-like protein AA n=1 Tax=Drosophila albomicans TaxID=7291 RepID=A0A6P8XKD8_DROAB|nr:myb-like protein AA [Drosophila albomicans]XP_051863803.1 myb-like protein AA [Drosophila albomicans]XP_051863804.1 myb-like protein AA [Drosophila albomicans]